MTFAPNFLGAAASALMCVGAAWILVFIIFLIRAYWIVSKRDKPLRIVIGSGESFYTITENDNIVDQAVSVKLENIADILVGNCKIQITYIKPYVTDVHVPIFMREYLSIPGGKHERILIARFMKPKAPGIASQFRLCAPSGGWNGSQFILPGKAYDIAIEASCDEAQERSQVNCRILVDEINTLRLSDNTAS